MKLVSDFSDYYDHHFDGKGPEFRRVSTEGPTKREQFDILAKAGYRVPPHGLVSDVHGSYWESEQGRVKWVVAYEDERAHCGEGKRLLSDMEVKWGGNVNRLSEHYRLNSLFCSAYVGFPFNRPSVSWRLLQIGRQRFWIEYKGDNDWRSNVGEGSCEVIGHEMGVNASLHKSLYAIDFVLGKELYAIDFNVSPGIRGSGVEKLMSAKAVVNELERGLA